jgi:four helix bundle protein
MPRARTPCAGAATNGALLWGAVTGSARGVSMTTEKSQAPKLPHHTLVAYELCLDLVRLISSIRIGDPQLRAQARKAAASAALNAAEGAARESAGDKRRTYGIASGEACEACAAVEIAGALGTCAAADVQAVLTLVLRIRRVFYPLVR